MPQHFSKKHFCNIEPHDRYTNTISKASLAVYGTWFALVVNIDDYEGEFYPETTLPTYKEIRAWIKERYGFTVNSASISQTKKKYGLIADTEGRYVQKVRRRKRLRSARRLSGSDCWKENDM